MTAYATTNITVGHTTTRSRHGHRHAQGFCTVCGSTWPCWDAQIEDAKVAALRTAVSVGFPRW